MIPVISPDNWQLKVNVAVSMKTILTRYSYCAGSYSSRSQCLQSTLSAWDDRDKPQDEPEHKPRRKSQLCHPKQPVSAFGRFEIEPAIIRGSLTFCAVVMLGNYLAVRLDTLDTRSVRKRKYRQQSKMMEPQHYALRQYGPITKLISLRPWGKLID